MKKKVLNSAQVLKIKNSFSPEGQTAADAIIEAIEAMAEEQDENGLDELAAKVNEIIEGLKKVPEPVQEFIHNAIELKMKTVTAVSNNLGKAKAPKEVKNAVISAVMGYRGEDGKLLKNEIDAILTKNGIIGLTYADIIDFEIVDKFGNEDRLFSMLTKTQISRFFYSEADMKTATAIAKQWDKSKTVEKDIQQLDVQPKTIATDYVYKRQQVAKSDIDEVVRSNSESQFIGYITEELRRVVVNTCVMAILIGDAVNGDDKKVTVFEGIATKSVSDAFTKVVTAAGAVPTVTEVRTEADLLLNPKALKKVAVMSAATKTSLAGYRYASGGDLYYRSDAELAGQLGVDEIYTTDLMNGKGVIVFIPEEYYVLEKAEVDVAYPTWEKNVQNWQYEKNIGGKIHGLLSSAYIKPAA